MVSLVVALAFVTMMEVQSHIDVEKRLVRFQCSTLRSDQRGCVELVLLSAGWCCRNGQYGFAYQVLSFALYLALAKLAYLFSGEIDWSFVRLCMLLHG